MKHVLNYVRNYGRKVERFKDKRLHMKFNIVSNKDVNEISQY